MMFWENFNVASINPRVPPRLDLVLRVPAGADMESFTRGVEAVVTTMISDGLKGIEIHEPGESTLALLRERVPKDSVVEGHDGHWFLSWGGDVFRVVVVQCHFKKEVAHGG